MIWTNIKTLVVVGAAVAVIATGLGRTVFSVSGQPNEQGGGSANAQKATKKEGPSRKAKDLDNKLQTAGKFQYDDKPLGEVLHDLRVVHGINIVLDQNALNTDEATAPVSPAEVKVSIQLEDVPLETALRYLLRPVKLGFVNQDGVLVVTSRDKTMVRKVYAVAALLGQDQDKNVQALIQVIVNTIEPETWSFVSRTTPNVVNPFERNVFNPFQGAAAPPGGFGMMGGGMFGGNLGNMFGMIGGGQPPLALAEGQFRADGQGGSIVYFPGTKSLVVRQSFEVHREIEDLLKQLSEK